MLEKPSLNESYSDLSVEEIIAREQQILSQYRFAHCVRVSQTAVKLARQYHADEDKAAMAGFLHDYAKEIPVETYIQTIKEQNFDPDLLNFNRGVWHGIVGAYFVEKDLHIHDQEILNAIRRHTTGAVDMTILDKIVFMADYIEPGRDFQGVDEARVLTAKNIDAGVGYQLFHTLNYLVSNRQKVYPQTLISYNRWSTKTN